MFLLVFEHVFTFSCPVNIQSTFLNIIETFMLPLFFFISGYVGMKSVDYFNTKTYFSLIKKKIVLLFIPTVVFSTFMTITGPFSIFDSFFFTTKGWSIYWFTIALLVMFVLYYCFCYLFHTIKVIRIAPFIIYIISLVISYFTVFDNIHLPKYIALYNVFYYFQFFVLGTIFRTYNNFFVNLCRNNFFTTLVFIAFVISATILYNSSANIFASEFFGQLWPFISLCTVLVVRYAGLIMIYMFFLSLSSYFSANGRVSRTMQFVGRRTLDIYMLHYFFIPTLPICVANFFNSSENIVLQVFFGGCFEAAIIALCLFVSALIRNSDFLAHYLFGAKITDKSKA